MILAAGASRRAGPGRPKQFHLLGARPVWAWSVQACDRCGEVDRLVLVVPAGDWALQVREALPALALSKPVEVTHGGETRAASLQAGLKRAPGASLVVVHDAARPLASADLVGRVIAAARKTGAATAALPLTDAVRWRTARGKELYLDRDDLVRIQTPQAFRADLLRAAHARLARPNEADPPDDASLVAALGAEVTLVPGDPENLKITTAGDLDRAARLLGAQAGIRIGLGEDQHRLAPGRPFRLGGLTIPSDRGPVGHSDADVLCHAVADALLGAAHLGDLGDHFPPTESCRDLPGSRLVGRVVDLVAAAGLRILNIDAVVIAERPRLAPYRPRIEASLAEALRITPDRVSVKFKTAEGLDAVGRLAAISARCVASLWGTG